MQIILTKNVDKLGKRGDIRDVKFGYYNNYLAPKGLAFVATPARLKWAEGLQEKAIKAKEEVANKAEEYKKKLEGTTLTFEEKTTDKDTLYGSIGEKELIEALEEQAKISLDKKQILLKEPIKTVGSHKVTVNLADNVNIDISIEVKGSEE